jgi:hypothetical protein
MFFFPYAEILSAEGRIYFFEFDGLHVMESKEVYVQTIHTIILLSVIGAVNLVTIFLYKKRIIQMRVAFINMLLMLGFLGLIYYFTTNFASDLDSKAVSYTLFDAFPFIAAVLNYLAIRAIGRDEALVRSVDRIR